jgi:4-hydroxymandelate oxidase
MGTIENRWRSSMSRRNALASLATMFAGLAGSPLLRLQQDPHGDLRGHKRIPGFDEMMSAFDFEPICYANMTLERFDYMAHGDGSEWTLRRNRQAFDWVDILPGKAVDPKSVNLSIDLLGVKLTHPIYVAPSSGQGALHPDGEMGMYRGATAANTIMAIASGPSIPHPRIAAASTGPRWNQFYPISDLEGSRDSLLQYQDLGTKAIIITVDQQASVYERDLHGRNLGGVVRRAGAGGRGRGAAATGGDDSEAGPARGRGAGSAPGARTGAPGGISFPANNKYRVQNRRLWYNWDYVNEMRKVIKVPVVIKGIVTAEDAAECARQGVDAIIVSNHGGRSMDYGPSTLEVLPEIVAAVNEKIPVIIDSGFRRGSDVFKALALGASAVELGRAARWGLGAFGAAGTQRLLEIIQAELVQAAAFAGCANLKAIGKSNVKTVFV